MVRLNSRLEANVERYPDRPGYYIAYVAVNQRRAHPFDIWEGDWHEMTELERHAYLERAALTLLNRYGDAREIRFREDGQIIAREGEAEV